MIIMSLHPLRYIWKKSRVYKFFQSAC